MVHLEINLRTTLQALCISEKKFLVNYIIATKNTIRKYKWKGRCRYLSYIKCLLLVLGIHWLSNPEKDFSMGIKNQHVFSQQIILRIIINFSHLQEVGEIYKHNEIVYHIHELSHHVSQLKAVSHTPLAFLKQRHDHK